MSPLKMYDYLTMARERLFAAVRPLSSGEFTKSFEVGLGRIDRTLMHIMLCEDRYVQRMQKRDVPPYAVVEAQEDNPPPFGEIEQRWRTQAAATRRVIEAMRDWDAAFDFKPATPPGEPAMIYTVSPMDIFIQLVLHEVHHRAQVMAMLRQLGKPIKDDLDFNALMYKRRPA